jgi:ADP-ribosylglycohydrolase
MGLCLADSLIEKKGHFDPNDIMMRFILWWFYGYNNAFRFDDKRNNKHSIGLGGNISGSIEKYIKEKGKDRYTKYGNRNTSGNGSIMRNAAIPICYYLYEKSALELAKYQSLITHQGEEAAGCCQLLTFIIIKILNTKIERCYPAVIDEINIDKDNIDNNEKSLRNILDNLEDFQCNCISVKYLANSQIEQNEKKRNWNWKDKDFKYDKERAKKQSTYIGSYCMDGLAMALHVLYHTNNFKDAILKAVNLCGDADSLGSIVGQIGGAYYEVDSFPPDWIQAINKWDHNEIALRGYILCNLIPKTIKNINIKDNNIFRDKNEPIDNTNINGNYTFRRNKNENCCNIF